MKDKNTGAPINQEEISHYLKDIRKIKVMTILGCVYELNHPLKGPIMNPSKHRFHRGARQRVT